MTGKTLPVTHITDVMCGEINDTKIVVVLLVVPPRKPLDKPVRRPRKCRDAKSPNVIEQSKIMLILGTC